MIRLWKPLIPLFLQVVYFYYHIADALMLAVELEWLHLHIRVEHDPRPFSLSVKRTANQTNAGCAGVQLKP